MRKWYYFECLQVLLKRPATKTSICVCVRECACACVTVCVRVCFFFVCLYLCVCVWCCMCAWVRVSASCRQYKRKCSNSRPELRYLGNSKACHCHTCEPRGFASSRTHSLSFSLSFEAFCYFPTLSYFPTLNHFKLSFALKRCVQWRAWPQPPLHPQSVTPRHRCGQWC